MANIKLKENRPAIPTHTQLKLWIKAGGRCEFHGCNENLLKDGLTLRETNYSNIAHIVSWQPTGPRGNDPLPVEHRNEIQNLMLVCTKHHKLIDSKEHEQDYPKEILLRFKNWHEDRIEIICSSTPECKTTIIRLKTKIGDEIVKISDREIFEAIFPSYPEQGGIEIDLTGLPGDGDTSYWNTMKAGITEKIHNLYHIGLGNKNIEHLSVFAIGPIPLLVQLGFCIGNKIPAQFYQRHRDTQSWIWKETRNQVGYKVMKVSAGKEQQEVALILSLSGKIHQNDLPSKVREKLPIYEITLDGITPNPGFLQTKDSLERFREIYQDILGKIKQENKNLKSIHLFPAIPAPIAVLCGREILHKAHPALLVYDYNNNKGGFNLTLEVNHHDS